MFYIPVPDLTEALKFTPIVDYRIRYERRLERDFNKSNRDNKTDVFNRLRLGTDVSYGKNWSGSFLYQYAQDSVITMKANYGDDASDLYLGYVKYTSNNKDVITVGRQRISFGNDRLIGSADWNNVGRVFDAIRYQSSKWDLVDFKIAVASPEPANARLLAAGYTSKFGQTSYIYKYDKGTTADTRISTLSHLTKLSWKGFDFDFEGAAQRGKVATKDIEAWALHLGACRKVGSKTKVSILLDSASGGGNSKKTYTFDNLYPSNHKFYGNMDMQGWRNMNELTLRVDHKFSKQTDATIHWHSFGLRDASDAWYAGNGFINKKASGTFQDATGRSGKDIGSELDFEVNHKINKNYSIAGGLSVFNPGNFINKVNAGHADKQTWGYMSFQMRF